MLNAAGVSGTILFDVNGSLNFINPQNPAQVQFTPSTCAEMLAIKL